MKLMLDKQIMRLENRMAEGELSHDFHGSNV